MQPLIDLLPIIAFAVAFWLTDFHTAIAVIMAAMALQVAGTWLVKRTVSRMLLVSAALVIGLGGISLLLKNDLIFKWKPTVVNWLLATVFLASRYIGERPMAQRFMESVTKDEFTLSPMDWQRLNLMWVLFFLFLGAANIFVAYRYPV